MKLVTFHNGAASHAGRVEGDDVVGLPFGDVGELLRAGGDWQEAAAADGERHSLSEVTLLPTVTRPSKIFCLGQNYRDHVEEAERAGLKPPQHPVFFGKFAAALTGPRSRIMLPAASKKVDWEAELVVVIGHGVRNADESQAIRSIAGYAVGNDVSMRDWQDRTSQWLQGKTWEAASPLGPMVASEDVGGDGRPDLHMTCHVNGRKYQDTRTNLLLVDCVEAIIAASTIITLEPPTFLEPGDVMTTAIEGIGECVNEVYAE
jgi:acylpyruvate hydrolase